MSLLRAKTQLTKSRDKLQGKIKHIAEKARVDAAIVQIELDMVNKSLEALNETVQDKSELQQSGDDESIKVSQAPLVRL